MGRYGSSSASTVRHYARPQRKSSGAQVVQRKSPRESRPAPVCVAAAAAATAAASTSRAARLPPHSRPHPHRRSSYMTRSHRHPHPRHCGECAPGDPSGFNDVPR